MNDFESLCSKAEPYFDKKFDGLPGSLRGDVGKVISKLEWDRSSPQQRARKLLWHDLRRDPATDGNALAAHDTFADEAESLARDLVAAARARWNLQSEPTARSHVAKAVGDAAAIQRAFRVWFWKWWREHDRTAPSRDEVYNQFGRPRGIARRPSMELLKLVRADVRQKVGQKGTSK